jgi:hypothetical protein
MWLWPSEAWERLLFLTVYICAKVCWYAFTHFTNLTVWQRTKSWSPHVVKNRVLNRKNSKVVYSIRTNDRGFTKIIWKNKNVKFHSKRNKSCRCCCFGLWRRVDLQVDANVPEKYTLSSSSLQSWRWRHYVSPKRWYLQTSSHGVTTQKNNIGIFTAFRTLNLTSSK